MHELCIIISKRGVVGFGGIDASQSRRTHSLTFSCSGSNMKVELMHSKKEKKKGILNLSSYFLTRKHDLLFKFWKCTSKVTWNSEVFIKKAAPTGTPKRKNTRVIKPKMETIKPSMDNKHKAIEIFYSMELKSLRTIEGHFLATFQEEALAGVIQRKLS